MSLNKINLLLGIKEATFSVPLWDIILSFFPWYIKILILILDDLSITSSIVFIISEKRFKEILSWKKQN